MNYEIKYHSVLSHGRNVLFEVANKTGGASAIFRINYSDNSRKNATYRTLSVLGTYLEKVNPDASFKVQNFTDLCLWVERNSQWALEQIQSEARTKHIYLP